MFKCYVKLLTNRLINTLKKLSNKDQGDKILYYALNGQVYSKNNNK